MKDPKGKSLTYEIFKTEREAIDRAWTINHYILTPYMFAKYPAHYTEAGPMDKPYYVVWWWR